MAITDPAEDTSTTSEQVQLPTLRELRWPVVQALRDLGGAAADAELVDHVAEVIGLTHQQRTVLIPSGQETKLKNRVNWTVHELKEVGVIHYPEPGRRALTALGTEADEERISDLRAAFEASKSSSSKQVDDQQRTDPPTAWVIRSGRQGERYGYNIEHGLAGIDFGQFLDLRNFSSRDELKDAMRSHHRDAGNRTISNHAGQLWRIRTDVRVGDLVVMPHKTDPHVALGTVTREYAYVGDDPDSEWPHVVSVNWDRPEVPWTAIKEDLRSSLNAQQSIFQIQRHDASRRFQQLLETGQDPGAPADTDDNSSDLSALVEQFLTETEHPTEEHTEQEQLREEWAEKLALENLPQLSREDLLFYTSNAVDYGTYVLRRRDHGRTDLRQQWITDLDDAQYGRLLNAISDLCWGQDELPARIDRLVDQSGAARRDTGIRGFSGINVSSTLAICLPDRFIPVSSQIGVWGREIALRALGLPKTQGSYGQRVVDANDRLRQRLAPYLDDDPQTIARFLYWLMAQKTDSGGGEPDDDLSVLVTRFRDESGYPTEAHEEQERLRAEWAEKLTPENIAKFSRQELTAVASHGIWNRAMYVYPNPRGVMQWIRDLDDEEYAELLDHIRYLCWDEDEMWVRYDQLTDSRSSRKVKGLKNETTSKLLAICHPEDFPPIGTHDGRWSRQTMLRRLGLPAPRGSSHGQRVLDANDRLREHLEPHFGDDTLGMGAFLEWLLDQEPPPSNGPIDLAELADGLLVDVEFLEDIVSLLEDKGQVILYGPPGTGKTYLARKLAKVLAPDDSCRALVQFHPSTSYEDFFEGYRPSGTGDDGGIRFKLTPGPLARIAEQAEASDRQHVMIIDEINRGNLPRVLGELLFLLEYRDESVQTLYRPKQPFSLPDNLWFIGTMNTADRSIALVDAALRRRFHFVPFFPDSGPMAGLLGRWLDREDEPGWIGRLVDAVNDELKAELEGSHLLLGPSHFMKEFGSSPDEQREQLRRIWEYNIEPFIEDQFFGDPEQIDGFRFNAVMRRHGPAVESAVEASDDSDDPESTNGSEGEHAVADGDAAAEPGSTPGSER